MADRATQVSSKALCGPLCCETSLAVASPLCSAIFPEQCLHECSSTQVVGKCLQSSKCESLMHLDWLAQVKCATYRTLTEDAAARLPAVILGLFAAGARLRKGCLLLTTTTACKGKPIVEAVRLGCQLKLNLGLIMIEVYGAFDGIFSATPVPCACQRICTPHNIHFSFLFEKKPNLLPGWFRSASDDICTGDNLRGISVTHVIAWWFVSCRL